MTDINKVHDVYTVSKMLNSINETMAPVGGKVQLKRKMDNGIMLNTSEKEIKYLDYQAKLKASKEVVANFSISEKKQFVVECKCKGNEYYKIGQYENAMDTYLQAMTGIDYGLNDENKEYMQKEFQLPLTCNLAACMIALKKWNKVIEISNQALSIDPNCYKALRRRGQAYIELENFDQARNDLKRAMEISGEIKEIIVVKKQLKKLEQAIAVNTKQRRKQKLVRTRMMNGVSGLYDDKKDRTTRKDAQLPSKSSVFNISHTFETIWGYILYFVFYFFTHKKRK